MIKFLIALDLKTGKTVWKTERPGLLRSWSTPILVPAPNDRRELIVNATNRVFVERLYPRGGGLSGRSGSWAQPYDL